MKKKIITSCLVVALLVLGIAGASLAYFTDTDAKDNTFTVGNVDIQLNEQQTSDDGLVAFEQNKQLKPGTSKDGNALSKIVTVKNTGKNDAWVWVELRIPAALVSKDFKAAPNTDESKNALHWNSYGHFTTAYNAGNKYMASAIADGIIDANGNVTDTDMVAVADGLWNDFKYVGIETTDDGNQYVVVRATMAKTLPAGKTSLPALRQVYMDWRVTTGTDAQGNAIYNLPDGTTVPVDGTNWEVKVQAYAIQADGITSVDAAIAAFADNGN